MNIEKAKQKHVDWLNEVISEEFPYTSFTREKISEKITDPNYFVLIARQANIMTGFCEMQFFFDTNEARLNAIYVDESWRDQGIAKAMMHEMINECKRRKVSRFFLLVKENNEDAKALYERTGFKFEKMHDKLIEGEKVEVRSQQIDSKNGRNRLTSAA